VLGVAAFCMLAPLVFLIQFTLVNLWKPTQHPLILMLKDNPSPGLFAVASFAAVVVAPIVEEYFFRGLLQGWLESLTRRHTFEDILVGVPAKATPLPPSDAADKNVEAGDVENFSDPRTVDADVAVNPYATPVLTAEVPGNANDENEPNEPHVPVWPMFVSATLFALAHYSHGPDWVPLFVLALGLGYLYQRTHRLVPCMTVHFLLNLASMGVLYLEVFLRVGASQ
jgi:membrane protease YdiL (CAAX protease family)